MANIQAGNTFYIDSTSGVIEGDVYVIYILFNTTAASSTLTLKDRNPSPSTKLTLSNSVVEPKGFDLSEAPMLFSGGLQVTAATNCNATLVIRKQNG